MKELSNKTTVKAIVKILIVLTVIIVIAILVLHSCKARQEAKYEAEHPECDLSYDITPIMESYEEQLAEGQSDIEGWTNLDKKNAGLIPEDGSDTDNDGLTDQEEIEIYNSDPLLKSTAGDLYLDGYKVENGMDVNTYYEYEGEIASEWAETPDIKLTYDDIEDTYAVAKEIGNYLAPEGYTVLKSYNVYDYEGNIDIDISSINENSDDITVLWLKDGGMTDENATFVDFTLDGNTLHINEELTRNNDYIIMICTESKDKGFIGFISGLPKAFASNDEGIEVSEQKGINDVDGFVIASDLLGLIGVRPKMYFVGSGDEDVDNFYKEILAESADAITEHNLDNLSGQECEDVSQERLNAIRAVAQVIFPSSSYVNKEMFREFQYSELKYGVVAYWSMEDLEYSSWANKKAEAYMLPRATYTGFSRTEDAFPFPNYSTEYSAGHCVGLTSVELLTYSGKGIEPTKEFILQNGGNNTNFSYDITTDEGNAPLLNGELGKFKTAGYVDAHTDQKTGWFGKGLSDGEQNASTMIYYYQEYVNYIIHQHGQALLKTHNGSGYNYELINEIKRRLDQGEVFLLTSTVYIPKIAALNEINGTNNDPISGHAVLITGYREESFDGDVTYFTIYDPNFPGENPRGNKEMKIKKDRDSFSYSYQFNSAKEKGVETRSMLMTNDKEYIDTYYFAVVDSNLDVISLNY